MKTKRYTLAIEICGRAILIFILGIVLGFSVSFLIRGII